MRYRYRSDDELNDSGVEWIGNIPKDWEVRRLKNFTKIYGRIGFRGYTVDDLVEEGEGAITLSPSNIDNQKLVLDKKTYISLEKYEESPEIKIFNGDILLVKTASVGKVALVKDLYEKATINPQFVVFKNIKSDTKFLYYSLISNMIQEQIRRIVNGGVVSTLTQHDINNYSLTYPSQMEQEKIANFLDEKTSQFDSIISKKEELIKKLEEAKKSLISEVVTGKVKVVKTDDGYELVKRSSEEMKDSGVEWLGEIPKEWHLEKGKWLFYNSNEKGDESKILLSATQDRGVIPKEQLDSVVQNKEDTDFTNFKLVKKYDFIISLRSFQGGFEMSEYDEGIITPAYSVLRRKIELNPYYYKYLLKERGFIGILNSLTVGIRDGKNIKYDDFAKVVLPKPSLKEQQIISNYINISILNINSTTNKTKKQIEKLKEAKQSLISEAVTGKIEILD